MTKKITAAELMEKLIAEPDFVAQREQAEQARVDQEAQWRRAEAPLVTALRAAGFSVSSAWDFVNTAEPYPDALPILFEHLERAYPGAIREGIARALAVPESLARWDLLARLYRTERDPRAKDGLAVAIAAAADDSVLEDLISLAQDPANGPSRLLLLTALERSIAPRARAALMMLGTDPQLADEVQQILRRSKREKGKR
jgi:hypothetical protein